MKLLNRHMPTIRVRDPGTTTNVGEGRTIPIVSGGFVEYDVSAAELTFWQRQTRKERDRIWKESLARGIDVRELIDERLT